MLPGMVVLVLGDGAPRREVASQHVRAHIGSRGMGAAPVPTSVRFDGLVDLPGIPPDPRGGIFP